MRITNRNTCCTKVLRTSATLSPDLYLFCTIIQLLGFIDMMIGHHGGVFCKHEQKFKRNTLYYNYRKAFREFSSVDPAAAVDTMVG